MKKPAPAGRIQQKGRKMRQIGIWATALLMGMSTASAQEPVSFQGKTVLMVIGYAAGGGTDAAGRLIAASLGKYLPGQPTIVVQNIPGADGMVALNYLVQQSKPDGLTITMGSGTQIDPLHYRKPQAKYDPVKLNFIGGAGKGGTVLIINKDAEKRIFDKKADPVIMGALSGMPRSGMQMTGWGKEFFDWNVKWVVGYRGTNDLTVALERGEIDMTATGTIPLVQKMLATGKFKILAQSGMMENGQFVQRPEFGNAPIISKEMAGKIKDPIAQKGFEYWAALNSMDKWLALPPDTPKPIVEAYRKAFIAMSKDPLYVERGSDYAPTTHQDIETLVHTLSKTPNESIEFITTMLRGQGLAIE
jgi:tripartite-type tricarboxylate transporter receptor subunit TctC